jgi:hypothetical protein
MSSKASIIYIEKDGSHIYWETNQRDITGKHFAIIGAINMRNVIETITDPAKDTTVIKLGGNMLDIFLNNTIALDLSAIEDYSNDEDDIWFVIKPGHPFADVFMRQIINKTV